MQTPTAWYYADAQHQRQGPMSAQALIAAVRRNELGTSSLVWRSGLADWQPLESVLAELGLSAILAPPPRPQTPAPPPLAAAAPGDIVYAGFLRRWVALLIDGVLLGLPLVALYAVAVRLMPAGAGGTGSWQLLACLLWLAAAPMYFAGLESSRRQATFGKRALGIKVTDLDGRRIGPGHALGRWAAATLSYASLCTGFFMAGFTERRQALHDFIARTLVVDRWAFTDHPERQRRGHRDGAIALLVVLALAVPAIGIIATIALPSHQETALRAEVASALLQARSLQVAVAESHLVNGRCPDNGDEGFSAPSAYAQGKVAAIVLVAREDGRCSIDLTLAAPESVLDAHHLRLTTTEVAPGAMLRWECSTDLPARIAGSACASGLPATRVAP